MDSFGIEATVIAALLSGDGRAGEIIAALRTEDFSEGINQAIFSFAVKLFSEGSPVNATTVANEIARKNPEESAERLFCQRYASFQCTQPGNALLRFLLLR